MKIERIDTPIGGLWLGEEEGEICLSAAERPAFAEEGSTPLLRMAAKQISEYFAGTRTAFELPLKISAKGFGARVYEEMSRIPYGETISYKELAKAAGSPNAARAVGNICGADPLILLIPCHRVICSDGSIGGYALGREKKTLLLELEKNTIRESFGHGDRS